LNCKTFAILFEDSFLVVIILLLEDNLLSIINNKNHRGLHFEFFFAYNQICKSFAGKGSFVFSLEQLPKKYL